MRQLVKQLKLAAFGVAICSILVASLYAAEQIRFLDAKFPGLDRHGNLDLSAGGVGQVKIVIDTTNRSFVARAFPVVKNFSHKKHTFYDVHTVALRNLARRLNVDPTRIRITKDIYYVDEPKLFDHHNANARAYVSGELRR